MRKLKLQANDNQVFEVDIDFVNHSETIKALVKHCSKEDAAKGATITLETISSDNLYSILDWYNHHKNMKGMTARELRELTAWEDNFFKREVSDLVSLLLSATYLKIKALTDPCASVVSKMMKEEIIAKSAQNVDNAKDNTQVETSMSGTKLDQIQTDKPKNEKEVVNTVFVQIQTDTHMTETDVDNISEQIQKEFPKDDCDADIKAKNDAARIQTETIENDTEIYCDALTSMTDQSEEV